MYNNTPFEKLESVMLGVINSNITFLAEQDDKYRSLPHCQESRKLVSFIWPAEIKTREPLTTPFTCIDHDEDTQNQIRHSFMIPSDLDSVHLFSRDSVHLFSIVTPPTVCCLFFIFFFLPRSAAHILLSKSPKNELTDLFLNTFLSADVQSAGMFFFSP